MAVGGRTYASHRHAIKPSARVTKEKIMTTPIMEPQDQFRPFTLAFKEGDNELTTKDLSGYFYYFRALYAVIAADSPYLSVDWILDNKSDFIQKVRKRIKDDGGARVLREAHSKDMGSSEPKILTMKKESPLEIVIVGSVVCMVAAAVISGGEVDLKVAKFKLNPIGDGLKKIRDLFRD